MNSHKGMFDSTISSLEMTVQKAMQHDARCEKKHTHTEDNLITLLLHRKAIKCELQRLAGGNISLRYFQHRKVQLLKKNVAALVKQTEQNVQEEPALLSHKFPTQNGTNSCHNSVLYSLQ